MPRTVLFPASSSMSETSTQAPSSANNSLMALPTPFAPPLPIATLPFSRSMITPKPSNACHAATGYFFRVTKDSVRCLGQVADQFIDVFVTIRPQGPSNSQSRHECAQVVEDGNGHATDFEFLFFIVDGIPTLTDLCQFFSQQVWRSDGFTGVVRE